MNVSRAVKLIILLITAGVHVVVLFTITVRTGEKKQRVIKLKYIYQTRENLIHF